MARIVSLCFWLSRTALAASTAMLLGFTAAVAAPAVPSAEQMQAWLHKEVDRATPFPWLASAASDAVSRGHAHLLLDRLWDEAAYRAHMGAWLNSRQADALENILADWYRHYHAAFDASLEFLDDAAVRHLWRLSGSNTLYALDRSICDQTTPAQLNSELVKLQHAYLRDHGQQIVGPLAKALAREFARLDRPVPGDRPLMEVLMPIVMRSFHDVANSLPADDGERLRKLYSYNRPHEQLSHSEACQRLWVAARAIEDANPKGANVSATLLRRILTGSSYQRAFDPFDKQGDLGKPAIASFVPGAATLVMPRVGLVNNVNGETDFEIAVDENGKVTSVTLQRNALSPRLVTSIDGSQVDAGQQYKTAVERYLRAGTFAPRVANGNPMPYKVLLPFHWD